MNYFVFGNQENNFVELNKNVRIELGININL